MAKKHEDIAKALSAEARKALIDTGEGRAVALPRGPLRPVVERELRDANLMYSPDGLSARGEVVREYVLEQELGKL